MFALNINGIPQTIDDGGDVPLLWVLRDHLNLTGTKFGCGAGLCGACSVHLDGKIVRSCQVTLAEAADHNITTIEDVAKAGPQATIALAVQDAWIAEQVPQCGYCQSGMVMAATALLVENATPSDDDIDAAMTNICRCGTYGRVRTAIHRASETLSEGSK